ncbi:hypothetical protein [Halobacteriovorax sp. DPLXC-1]|uniref:hypothetical protein n=1 Tax=unclassified Halobacteriovorax TaxID=2639665 RepID=UPI002FF04F6B
MKTLNSFNPLESRTYKFKKAHIEFFCPLCRTQRAVVTNPHLDAKNYLQIFMLTVVTTAILYPFMSFAGVFSFFLYWAGFEATLRLTFKKEIPCPHCGFDASWYKKDVRIAKAKVKEFWQTKGGHGEISPDNVDQAFEDMTQ